MKRKDFSEFMEGYTLNRLFQKSGGEIYADINGVGENPLRRKKQK